MPPPGNVFGPYEKPSGPPVISKEILDSVRGLNSAEKIVEGWGLLAGEGDNYASVVENAFSFISLISSLLSQQSYRAAS